MMDFLEMVVRDTSTMFMVLVTGTVVICTLIGAVSKTVTSLSRERTRREVAAYIAEGSMTPEQGERILAARHRE
jgi:hypothetical protein